MVILLWSERVHGKSETGGAESKTGDHEDYLSIQMRRPKSDEFKRKTSQGTKQCLTCPGATELLQQLPKSGCVTCKQIICHIAGCACNNYSNCQECKSPRRSRNGKLF